MIKLLRKILFLVTFMPSSAFGFNWAQEIIQAPRAWLRTTAAEHSKPKFNRRTSSLSSKTPKPIVVAVIDTGVDINHPDLKSNIWKNPNEIPANHIDDDHNGFVDDVYGWNFASNNNSVADNHGHGTHIAGIIAANGRSRPDVKGVAPNAEIMVIKYYDPFSTGADNLKASVDAIYYAIRMKADIINYSGGGIEKSSEEENALRLAERSGILVVAAAGNERSNSDVKGFYPASYGLKNILSVTAHDEHSDVLPFSNYGSHSVQIAAPGKNILSTLPNNKFGEMTGTSQATAFVSGACALLMEQHKDFQRPEQVIYHLAATGSFERTLFGKTIFKTRLNILRALSMSESDSKLPQKLDVIAKDNSENL
jgi:thermitase